MPVTGRFAPSPSGRMHLGNLWSSLLAWLAARSAGGRMVLRLEDLDPDRCTQAWCDQVMRDLEWLGLDWDNEPVYQSRRTPAYEAAFRQLEEKRLVYPCFCTRAERMAASAPHRSDGQAVYDGRCRRLTAEQREDLARQRNPAWRLAVPDRASSFRDLLQGMYEENLLRDCGDFILRRSDGVYAYQLAVVCDDGDMGITQVVRGRDLLDSTPRQLYLYGLLGLTPPQFYHFPLLLTAEGKRLSKRDGAVGLDSLQERLSPEEILGRLGYLAGINPSAAPKTAEALLTDFDWERVPRADIRIPEGLFE